MTEKNIYICEEINITIISGKEFYFYEEGFKSENDVLIELTIEEEKKSTTVWSSSNEPNWNMNFSFKNVKVNKERPFLKVEAFDVDEILEEKNSLGYGYLYIERIKNNQDVVNYIFLDELKKKGKKKKFFKKVFNNL
jgi:hypothetical protein